MKHAAPIALAFSVLACMPLASADAQLFYVGARAGAAQPTGTLSDEGSALLTNATPGLGYGLDAGIGAGFFGLYAGYDHIQFNCHSASCNESGKYELEGYSGGLRVGIPLFPLVKPWGKAGLTYNRMTGKFSSGTPDVETKKGLGYEIGAGVDIPIVSGFLSLTPQARLIRQRLELGGEKRDANYYTFDIGLRLRSPI